MAPLNPELDGRFSGCTIPFQYVNPYYHELTARTCVNILGYNLNRVPTTTIEYQIGCDCVFPFAMNYNGQCIQEDECNEHEAFGKTANKSNEKNKSGEMNSKALKRDQRSQQPQSQPPLQQQEQQRKQQNDSENQRTLTNSARAKY